MTPGRTFRDFMRPPPRRPTDPEGNASVERDNEILCSGCGASWTAAQGWGTP